MLATREESARCRSARLGSARLARRTCIGRACAATCAVCAAGWRLGAPWSSPIIPRRWRRKLGRYTYVGRSRAEPSRADLHRSGGAHFDRAAAAQKGPSSEGAAAAAGGRRRGARGCPQCRRWAAVARASRCWAARLFLPAAARAAGARAPSQVRRARSAAGKRIGATRDALSLRERAERGVPACRRADAPPCTRQASQQTASPSIPSQRSC